MSDDRPRLDELLVERHLARSRSHAKALILAGRIDLVDRRPAKPGTRVPRDVEVAVVDPPRYVSRGGDKLAAALEASGLDPRDRVALDVGSSTGGFTDCLLQHGARHVVAVDVGYGQLDWTLRQDDRVTVLERTNARDLEPGDLPDDLDPPRVMVMDVAFIGVAKVLPAVTRVCAPDCRALVLVKPQFECGPEAVGRGGVVRDATLRRQALEDVAAAARGMEWDVLGAIPSPLRGAEGNWECFLHLARDLAGLDPAAWHARLDSLPIPDDTESGGGS